MVGMILQVMSWLQGCTQVDVVELPWHDFYVAVSWPSQGTSNTIQQNYRGEDSIEDVKKEGHPDTHGKIYHMFF